MRAMEIRDFCLGRLSEKAGLERCREYFLDPPSVAENGQLTTRPRPSGNVPVCAKFFTFATGKSTNFLYQPSQAGRSLVLNIERDIFRVTPKEDAVAIFLKDISEYYQLSPDSNLIFLPFPKRATVHQIYADQAEADLQCHKAYFLQVWRKNPLCNHIKLRKHLRFALCDTCVDFRDLQMKPQTYIQRLILKKAQLEHHAFVKKERQLYVWRRERGRDPNQDVVSMIVDAADQAKYALPYHHIATHESQKALRVPVHLMGVLVHGEHVHAYTYFENFKQGNNVTIQAIHSALCSKMARDGRLPSTFYLQLDNTSKQCKARFMIGWLGYLVYRGVFRHIVLSFLPVGHTHEDIDQVFSRLSVYLSCHDALNMEQLHKAIRQSYQTREGQRADCEFWPRCANFSEWISPYLTSYEGISRYRQFRFYKTDGDVRVQARVHTSESQEWAGIRGQDAFTDVFRSPPPARMQDVPPTQRRDLLSDELIEKQRKSILRLARKRHIPVELIADVIEGMESVGDPDDLEFDWDLSQLLNYEAPLDLPDGDEDMADGADPAHQYEYELDQVLLLKPPPGGANDFWLAKVVGLGVGNNEGQYQVYWMHAAKDYGLYSHTTDSQGNPCLDWVWEEAVQDNVLMRSHGRRLTARAVLTIQNFVMRWHQGDHPELDEFGLDPDASENEVMDQLVD
jgi:hypothetical protein